MPTIVQPFPCACASSSAAQIRARLFSKSSSRYIPRALHRLHARPTKHDSRQPLLITCFGQSWSRGSCPLLHASQNEAPFVHREILWGITAIGIHVLLVEETQCFRSAKTPFSATSYPLTCSLWLLRLAADPNLSIFRMCLLSSACVPSPRMPFLKFTGSATIELFIVERLCATASRA